MKLTIAEEIANFICKTNFNDIPEQVIEKSKQSLLDCIGVALYGCRSEASKISEKVICSMESKKEASVIGTMFKASTPNAALLNGIRSHVADYDDSLFDFGHPSAILMPVTLALSESNGADGKKMLTAFILGSEVGSKLGQLMGWKHYEAGWHSTGTIGTIGAVAAASKVLDLSKVEIVNAIGIAASSASGLRQNFGTMTKSWHAGKAAFSGIIAAFLAKHGYDSAPDSLEGENGFIKTFQGESVDFFNINMGNPYSIMDIQIKKYPSCHGTHASIEAVLQLKKEYDFSWEEIKGIECYGRPVLNETVLVYHEPKNELEAKYSVEFCVAAALIYNRLGISQFTRECVLSGNVKSLMQKVSSKSDPKLEDISKKEKLLAPSIVSIILQDGGKLNKTVLEAEGGPRNPIHWEALEAKFVDCSKELLSMEQVKTIGDFVKEIEEVKNIAGFAELLRLKES
jgi:2-methylcitrate dehydratase PrpD